MRMTRSLQDLGDLLEKVRREKPLVHVITNMVAANPSANTLLSIGALPVLACDPEEVSGVVSSSQALVLNTGTLTGEGLKAMIQAGIKANKCGIPIILDPVGVSANPVRGERIKHLLNTVEVDVIRGNASEIAYLNGDDNVPTRGVESVAVIENPEESAVRLAAEFSAAVCLTGAVDYIAAQNSIWEVRNGHPMMSKVSGTGCMLSALIGAFCGVTGDYAAAAAGAVVSFGVCGETAGEKSSGPGSFQNSLLDALYAVSTADLVRRGSLKYKNGRFF